jgi:glutaredoxin
LRVNERTVRSRFRALVCALFACCLAAAAGPAHAQQYRWIDEKGRVQYSDTAPPPGAKDVRKKNLSSGAAAAPAEPYALQVARKNAPVKLYSSPDCGDWCNKARALLNLRGIPFTEISVSSAEDAEVLKKLSGGETVPTLVVGNSVQKGFLESSYQQALDAAGYPAMGTLKPRNQTAPPPPKPEPPAAAAQAPAAQAPVSPAPPAQAPAAPRPQ